jgi:ferredoxin
VSADPASGATVRVKFAGRVVTCAAGSNLREVLRGEGLPLYATPMDVFHCRGLGTCGTCAVEVRPLEGAGDAAITPMTGRERWRLGFPPHGEDCAPVDPDATLRLACQVRVEGDISCVRRAGLWGQGGPGSTER